MSSIQHVRAAVSELRAAISSGQQDILTARRQRDQLHQEVQRIHNQGANDPSREVLLRQLGTQVKMHEQKVQSLQSIIRSLSGFN